MRHAVALLLICNFLFCGALEFEDCGTPLTRWFSYESVTFSPSDNLKSNQLLSINIAGVVSKGVLPLDTVDTYVTVIKDGSLFLNVATRDLCSILGANDQKCTLSAGEKVSFTYETPVPYMPRGNYSVRILSVSRLERQEIGCLEIKTTVEGQTDADSCVYTSSFNAAIQGNVNFKNSVANQNPGDWIQVGPWAQNAGAARTGFDFGKFDSISGTKDIVGNSTVDAQNYIWGLNGTLNSTYPYTDSVVASNQVAHRYTGIIVIGYNVSGRVEFAIGGNFNFTFIYDPNAQTPSYTLLEGRLAMFNKYYHPKNFTYPIVVGNLNPISLTPGTVIDASSGQFKNTLSASRRWCTCGNVCDSNPDLLRTQTNGDNGSGLTLFEDGAIAVGVVGFVAVVMAIIFFVVHIRSTRRPVLDPAELVYPAKPDYGSMALSELIDDERV